MKDLLVKLYHRLPKVPILPSWFILFCDTILITLACILVQEFILTPYNFRQSPISPAMKIVIYVAIHAALIVGRGAHKIVIRYSNIDEVLILFKVFVLGTSCLIVTDHIQAIFSGKKIFVDLGLVLRALISFQTLFMFRAVAKSYLAFVNQTSKDANRTLVIGTDHNAVSYALALAAQNRSPFEIVGFVSSESNKIGLKIGNHYIYDGSTLNALELLRTLKYKQILISEEGLQDRNMTEFLKNARKRKVKIYKLDASKQEINHGNNEIVDEISNEELLRRSQILIDYSHLQPALNDQVVLVTGGAGSIGSELVRQLLQFNPKQIVVVDNAETPMHDFQLELKEFPNANILQFIVSDVLDEVSMHKVFDRFKPSYVYHVAAYKHVPLMEVNPRQALLVNVKASVLIAELACRYKAKKFVYVSTDKAVNPVGIMGMSKRLSELYLNAYFSDLQSELGFATKIINTRFGNVLRSNGSVLTIFDKQIKRGGPITITHPEMTRYFMTIHEAASLVLDASVMGKGGEFFVFDMGQPVKILDLAKTLIQMSGKDIAIEFSGLRPGEKMYEELIYDKAKDLPTHNPKILISEEKPMCFKAVESLYTTFMKDLDTLPVEAIKPRLEALLQDIVASNEAFKHPAVA